MTERRFTPSPLSSEAQSAPPIAASSGDARAAIADNVLQLRRSQMFLASSLGQLELGSLGAAIVQAGIDYTRACCVRLEHGTPPSREQMANDLFFVQQACEDAEKPPHAQRPDKRGVGQPRTASHTRLRHVRTLEWQRSWFERGSGYPTSAGNGLATATSRSTRTRRS